MRITTFHFHVAKLQKLGSSINVSPTNRMLELESMTVLVDLNGPNASPQSDVAIAIISALA